MEIVALELWRALPDDEAEDELGLRSFSSILNSWLDRALPRPDTEEYYYAIQTILDTLYQVRKWKQENEAYRQCEILMSNENRLFKIIEPDGIEIN